MKPQTISCDIGGLNFSYETGRLARQANGSVLAKVGDTVVLATAVMGNVRPNIDFFPLLVDYEERLYAAGKIKGSRWVKREGRATDEAILSGRVIDRTLRPLFPSGMRNDVQIVATIMSVDPEIDPDMVAVNAAAMALAISDIPFDGPVAAVRVGKIDGKLVVNPTKQQMETSTMDLIVSGTGEHIMMVEAGAKFVTEDEIIEGVAFAQSFLKTITELQNEFAKQLGTKKAEVKLAEIDTKIKEGVANLLTDEKIDKALYVPSKAERESNEDKLYEEAIETVKASLEEVTEKTEKDIREAVNYRLKKYQQKQILDNERRVDGRKLTETRVITCEVGVLPRTHGSALFTRGETQALTTVTLGSKGDEQILDGVEDPTEGRSKRYMHHIIF
jgi:polyribonucleotide nucleotidyltransferase